MRERIRRALDRNDDLPTAARSEFLLYLMGPYEAFTVDDHLPETVDRDDVAVDFGSWDDDAAGLDHDEVLALLERVRDDLRRDAGLNAFLAIDANLPLEEMDAATQSIRFAASSNVTAFVVPRVGKNLGVGIETGSVLASLDDADRERLVFVHESGVRSAMIDSLSRRWNASVHRYDSVDELTRHLRTFAVDVMNRELYGSLPRRGPESEDGGEPSTDRE